VLQVSKHPERDNLYVEKIDLGEESGPRTIVSGLANYISPEKLQGRMVVVVANLKASKFAGVLSQGMVLAASNADKTMVEILDAPDDSIVGESVTIEGFDRNPDSVLNPKHKVLEKVVVEMSTSDKLIVQFKGLSLKTSTGEITVESLKNATIG
jgi:tRNA-binding EMAP/Myf-like protein